MRTVRTVRFAVAPSGAPGHPFNSIVAVVLPDGNARRVADDVW